MLPHLDELFGQLFRGSGCVDLGGRPLDVRYQLLLLPFQVLAVAAQRALDPFQFALLLALLLYGGVRRREEGSGVSV